MFNNSWHKDRAIDTGVEKICIIELTKYNSISELGTEYKSRRSQQSHTNHKWVEASHGRQAKASEGQ